MLSFPIPADRTPGRFRAPEYTHGWEDTSQAHSTQTQNESCQGSPFLNPQSPWAGPPGCRFSRGQSQACLQGAQPSASQHHPSTPLLPAPSIILPKTALAVQSFTGSPLPCKEPTPSGLAVKSLKSRPQLPAQRACWEPSYSGKTERPASSSSEYPPVRERRTLLLLAHPARPAKGSSRRALFSGEEHEESEG